MANHPSAERRNRQRIKRTARNRVSGRSARSALKKARAAIAAGDAKQAEALVRAVESKIDRAATKGSVHRRAASRIKSRLYAQLDKLAKS